MLHSVPAFQSRSVPNHLLAALPAEHLLQLLPELSQVGLSLGQELYAPDVAMDAVYFPASGMISMVTNLEDGVQAEVGVIGRKGMLGTALLSGATTSFIKAMVQMPGMAWRMGAREFRQELNLNTPLRQLLLRYSEGLSAQIMGVGARMRLGSVLAAVGLLSFHAVQAQRRLPPSHSARPLPRYELASL